jgi:hypothetical protein
MEQKWTESSWHEQKWTLVVQVSKLVLTEQQYQTVRLLKVHNRLTRTVWYPKQKQKVSKLSLTSKALLSLNYVQPIEDNRIQIIQQPFETKDARI